MELNKKTLRNIFLVVSGCIVLYWVLHETERVTAAVKTVWALFSPFAVGAAVAFILNVPMRAIERWLKPVKKDNLRRGFAILLTLLAVLLVVAGVIWLVIPQVIATVETLLAEIPGFVNRVVDWGKQWLAANPELRDWLYENTKFEDTDWSELLAYLFNVISSQMESIVNKLHQTMDQLLSVVDVTFKVVVAFANGVFNAVLSLVFALYCLGRKEILARQGYQVLYALITSENTESVIFHQKMGYERKVLFSDCGFKFNRWLGLIWMEKRIKIVHSPSEFPKPWQIIVQDAKSFGHILDNLSLSYLKEI